MFNANFNVSLAKTVLISISIKNRPRISFPLKTTLYKYKNKYEKNQYFAEHFKNTRKKERFWDYNIKSNILRIQCKNKKACIKSNIKYWTDSIIKI